MNEVERVKKALKVISTNGDLYDVIAKAKNVKPTSCGFGRFHVLLFSRILFAGVLLKDKIRSYFSPVEKVHDAQEEIHTLLGFNVDVIKEKRLTKMRTAIYDNRKEVSLLYEDRNLYMDEYIGNVQKLLTFVSVHNIKTVYLSQNDIFNLFPGIDLRSFTGITRTSLLASLRSSTLGDSAITELTRPYDEDEELEEMEEPDSFLILDNQNLKRLLDMISSYKVDKRFVAFLGHKIKDLPVKKALEDFYEMGDISTLKNVLLARLNLTINSDSSYKSREYGKCYDTVSIIGEYVRVVTSYKNNKVENSSMLLCEYLGYPNYEMLLKSLNNPQDDEERILMAALYLYLCKQNKVKGASSKKTESFYDGVYNSFLETQTTKKKKVENLHGKGTKLAYNFMYYVLALYFTVCIIGLGVISGFAADFINTTFRGETDSNVLRMMLEYVITPYKYSWGIETQIIAKAVDGVDNIGIALNDTISSAIGDNLRLFQSDNKVVGVVRPVGDTSYNELPHYFAVEYGASSEYDKGNIIYDLQEVPMNYLNFSDYIQDLFATDVYFSKREIREMIDENYINIPLALHPVDDNYRLTAILIFDEKDKEKKFMLDAERAYWQRGVITNQEKELLLSIKKPVIRYYYGLSNYYLNAFVRGMYKDGSYLDTDALEMRRIITSALNLPPGATLNDIYTAIESKEYSTTPFKDAGLSRKIKGLDEKEFISAVASMDSLICNLAATLAVEANDKLIYVVGFYTDGTAITYGNAHAWAMDQYGQIIDITPSSSEEKSPEEEIVENVMDFVSQGPIALCSGLVLASMIIYNKLGKKVIFTIKAANVKSLLTSSEMGETYSLIYDTLYGGINLPMDYDAEEFLITIMKDYEGYTKEELKDLLEKLQEVQSKYKRKARRVVKVIPFIKANETELMRTLQKKKKKR